MRGYEKRYDPNKDEDRKLLGDLADLGFVFPAKIVFFTQLYLVKPTATSGAVIGSNTERTDKVRIYFHIMFPKKPEPFGRQGGQRIRTTTKGVEYQYFELNPEEENLLEGAMRAGAYSITASMDGFKMEPYIQNAIDVALKEYKGLGLPLSKAFSKSLQEQSALASAMRNKERLDEIYRKRLTSVEGFPFKNFSMGLADPMKIKDHILSDFESVIFHINK